MIISKSTDFKRNKWIFAVINLPKSLHSNFRNISRKKNVVYYIDGRNS